MKFLRTISKVRPFVKTIGGLKQIIRRGSGVVLPKLSRMSLENKTKPIKIMAMIKSDISSQDFRTLEST